MTSLRRIATTLCIASAGALSLGCTPWYDSYYGYGYNDGCYGPSGTYWVTRPSVHWDRDWRSWNHGRRDGWCNSGGWTNRGSRGGGWNGARSWKGGGGDRWSRR